MTKLQVVGSSCLFPRLFLVVGLVCLVVVGSSRIATSRKPTTHQQQEEEGQVVFSAAPDHKQLEDFNYMSKRRVPNGPDPIHNRRAGNSGRPPGQA